MASKFDLRSSIKHLQIDKANSRALISITATVAVVVFCLVAAQALVKQMNYQNKVIGLRNKANKQLVANIKSTDALAKSYQTFESASESVIGTADKNSIIVLDALPSKYDFPALATSLSGIIIGAGSKVISITGTDDEANAAQDSTNPSPIEIPFEFSASGDLTTIQKLIIDMERSIRPFQITALKISGDGSNIQADVTSKTYYQPEKKLDITQTVVSGSGKTASSTQGGN